MAVVIEMPKLSDTMEEGGIANWLKNVGDHVEEGDPLVEIETDKATQEYESPEEGVLLKIVADPGSTLGLGQPIAVIGEEGEEVDLNALVGAAKPAPAAAEPAPAPAAANGAAAASAATPKVVNLPGAQAKAAAPGGRVLASPLAKKVAAENGLDVAQIAGSGPAGRVVLKDVEGALAGGAAAQAQPATQVSVAPSVALQAGVGDEQIPVTMMRKTIAKRLVAGKNEAPHFYLTRSIDMAKTLAWRKQLNSDPGVADGKVAKVSVNDLIILSVAKALRRHPVVNSSWQGDHMLQHGSVHVAMAVALPTGLVTPVIRNTDMIGVRDIAKQSRELALAARDGNLANDAFQGGTFTVSNLGMFGIEEFTAIINPPQAAILAVGATKATPVVSPTGEIKAAQLMKITMSCDHRVIDGASGAQFLQTLASYLEDPMMMLT